VLGVGKILGVGSCGLSPPLIQDDDCAGYFFCIFALCSRLSDVLPALNLVSMEVSGSLKLKEWGSIVYFRSTSH
jgi:hypothetical protein